MKKEVKIAIIVVLVALLVGAAALYVKAARRPIFRHYQKVMVAKQVPLKPNRHS